MVIGLPKTKLKNDSFCGACVRRKQVRSSFTPKNQVSITKCLELIHMDLCGPMRVRSKGGKRYVFVIVDDFSRFTWTLFLASKEESFETFSIFIKTFRKTLGLSLISMRSDHGTEFENAKFLEYCSLHGIDHNFSAPRTPQQNRVVQRTNGTIEDGQNNDDCQLS